MKLIETLNQALDIKHAEKISANRKACPTGMAPE
jgi:hypothetical protein